MEENIAVWRVSRIVRSDPELHSLFSQNDAAEIWNIVTTEERYGSFRKTLADFLAEYGHRGSSERDPIYPRWRHNPRLLINQIKLVASGDDSLDPLRTETRLKERRQVTERESFAALASQPFGRLKTLAFRFCLKWTQTYLPFRDDVRFYMDHITAVTHDLFRQIGERLVAMGAIAEADDVFFLGFEEIVEASKGRLAGRVARTRVEARRRVYEKYRNATPPMYLRGAEAFDSDVVEANAEAGVLSGFAASAGRVSGRARVCRTLEEAEKIERGDILVACATDPGWTPVFSILRGVVVETGGILAHSTLVSREYGIPCVTNVSNATERIPDGSTVIVDGNQGKVFVNDDGRGLAEVVDPSGAAVIPVDR